MHPTHAHTVLLVDDDDAARHALAYYLDSAGCEVHGARDGDDALAQLYGGLRPCVIVLDVLMPGRDGWDVLAALRNDPALAAIPVVMLTGHPDHATQAVRLGVQTYFTKPAEPALIAAAVVARCSQRS